MNILQPGQLLGPYQIINQVGKGGMATVYKAYHAAMDRYVALKVVAMQLSDEPNFLQRFRREARLIAKLEHPHILPVYDFGEAEGLPYMVMRFLEAGTLKERLEVGPLSIREIDRIFTQLTDALEYAHENGVIHRDIKPSNAMLDKRGDIFLTDFGVAKMLEGASNLTATGTVTGTPSYMSSEQAQGLKVDQRSDIYSLGIVLFEMLTGHVPFEAETPMAVLFKQIQDPPPPLSIVRPDLPYTFEAVLLRAMAKNPADRHASMEEFRQSWKAALDEAIAIDPSILATAPTPMLPVSVSPPTPPSQPAAPTVAAAPEVVIPSPVPAPLETVIPAAPEIVIPPPVPASLETVIPEAPTISAEKAPPAEPIPTVAAVAAPARKRTFPFKALAIGGVVVVILLGALLALRFVSNQRRQAAQQAVQTPAAVAPRATLAPPATVVPPPKPTLPKAAAPTVNQNKSAPPGGKVTVRWFVGLAGGAEPNQRDIQKQVVAEFNRSQNQITLELEIVPADKAFETLSKEVAAGNAPDIIGPVGVLGSNAFHGNWLDLKDLIARNRYDMSAFNPALVRIFQTENGTEGIPFAVYPGAIYFQRKMFSSAGLDFPPSQYGKKYRMPDGSQVDWNWETVAAVARLLTIDKSGKNATQPGFDPAQIRQYGFVPQWSGPSYFASYYSGAAQIYTGSAKGAYKAAIPEPWKAAWRWWYDGMWGKQPFIPNAKVINSPAYNSNAFGSGKVAMALTQSWYLCCVGGAGNGWELAILPLGADGKVHGRVDADTFRIWKGTQHPDEAFAAMTYLVGPAAERLFKAYSWLSLPARDALQAHFVPDSSAQYPFVVNWRVYQENLAYPDVPSAEGNLPNFDAAWKRLTGFGDSMGNNPGLDLDRAINNLENDLNVIFNK